MKRINQIDLLKAIAIISVIILHSFASKHLHLIGAAYHIGQAVPIFMILAGFNSAHSNQSSVGFYKCLKERITKIIQPFLLIFGIEILIQVILGTQDIYNPWDLIKALMSGGYGPGSYFVPIFLQAIVILPILNKIAKYNSNMMLLCSLVINIVYELTISQIYPMSDAVYRLLIPRYLFALGLGVWLANNTISHKTIYTGAGISLIYITLGEYCNIWFPVHQSWGTQTVYSYMYPMLLVWLGIKRLPDNIDNRLLLILSNVGKASYHIFLVQMVYFLLLSYLKYKIMLIGAIPICIMVGFLFLKLESKVHNKNLIKKVES